jgi:hypothetical protein
MTVYRLTAAAFALSAALAIAAQSARAEPAPGHSLRHEHTRPFSPLDDLPQYRECSAYRHRSVSTAAASADSRSSKMVIEHKPGGRLKAAIKKK